MKWLRNMYNMISNPLTVKREILLQRLRGSSDSPFEQEDIEYVIVGSSEADSLNNKISNESPLGAAMLGKKVGDIVKVEAPIGVVEYKIVSVKND